VPPRYYQEDEGKVDEVGRQLSYIGEIRNIYQPPSENKGK
jgi:hypothetical protein